MTQMKKFLKWISVVKRTGTGFMVSIFILMVCSGFVGSLYGYHWGTGELPFFRSEIVLPPVTGNTTTEQNVSDFLRSDNTSLYAYGPDFNCVESVLLAARSAQWQGLSAGVVRLIYVDSNISHLMLVFPTTDSGWVFAEPQTGEIVNPQVGAIYSGQRVQEIDLLNLSWEPLEVSSN